MEDITQFTDVAPLIRKTGILALPGGPIAALRSLRPVTCPRTRRGWCNEIQLELDQ